MTKSFDWTDEATAGLRRLHAAGYSASQIAMEIGCPSRNAVIGKIHRLGVKRDKPAPLVRAVRAAKPAPLQEVKAKTRLHAGNIARKAASRRSESQIAVARQGLAEAAALDEKIQETVGILFLDRGLYQCAMPLPGWDALPVTEKRVCGRPVPADDPLGSSCARCARLVYAPRRQMESVTRQVLKGVAA